MRPAGVLDPPSEDVLIDEVGEEGSDRSTIHKSHPAEEDHHYCVDLFELIAVRKDLVYQLQLIVKKDLAFSSLTTLS
jgi:hypothetical protein